MNNLFERLHDTFVESTLDTPKDISNQAHNVEKSSFGIHLIALSLNKMGDALLDIKLVLPWLLTAVGAPGYFVAWLVPIRESLALLPQFFIAQWMQSFAIRKTLWSLGCIAQGFCVLAMAFVPWFLKASEAGFAILTLLTLFSLSRCLCSIVIKDVQGRTIDKQRRGRVSGLATSFAGVIAIGFAIALLLGWLSKESTAAISVVLFCAGSCWVLAGLVYWQLQEFPSKDQQSKNNLSDQFSLYWRLLKQKPVQHFLLVRGLLISTALVAPFYVVLATRYSEGTISALGILLLLAGIANLTSGWIWGKLSDLSSRKVMSIAGTLCFLLALFVYMAEYFHWNISQSYYFYGFTLFLLYIGHAGVRLGRATYLMDMAKEHNRTQLVALSNTVIGIILLSAGGLIALLSNRSVESAILTLGICSLMAALLALKLPEVSQV